MKTGLRCLAFLLLCPAAAAAETVPLHVPVGPRLVEGWPVILDNTMRFLPAVADVDGDGRDEIAVGVRDGRIFLLDHKGRSLPGWPREVDASPCKATLVDDIDGDGRYEVVSATYNGSIHAWRIDGTPVRGWPVECGGIPTSSPQLVRMNGGALRRILVSTMPDRVHLLAPDGTPHPGWPRTIGLRTFSPQYDTHPTAWADLDGDGAPEILHLASQEAVLYAWRSDGGGVPGFPRRIGDHIGLGVAVDDPRAPRFLACATMREIEVLDPRGEPLFSLIPPDTGDSFMAAPFFVSTEDPAGRPDRIFVGTRRGGVYLYDLDGRLQPGWPVRLGGFIYGVSKEEMLPSVQGPPLAVDVDGDGGREIVVGCYDQHLYALELDGSLVPGWPETVEDAIANTIALAQLDGEGEREIVVGQIGETMFAFRIGPHRPEAVQVSSPETRSRASSEWLPVYTFAAAAFALLAFLLARHVLLEHASGGPWIADRWTRLVLIAVLALAAVRIFSYVDNVARYAKAKRELAAADDRVRRTLEDERLAVERTADLLAARLDSSMADETQSPFVLLRHLERLADHYRFDYRFKGLLVADARGTPLVGTGLGRGWTDLGELGIASRETTRPILLESTPVFVGESDRGIRAGQDTLRFFFFSSLLGGLPDAVADATGYSAYIRLENRTLAWGGAALLAAPGMRPRLGRTQPSRDIDLPGDPGAPRLSIRLAMESYDRPFANWMNVAIVLLFPLLYLYLSARGALARVRLAWWWIPLFAAVYAAGIVMLRAAAGEAGHVALAGRSIEVSLNAAGALGLAVAARNVVASRRSKRLDVGLLGSYLSVALIPLAAIILVIGNLVRESQYRIVEQSIAGLADRADRLAIAYVGRFDFPRNLEAAARQYLNEPPEAGWFNFVQENHFLFTYDLPTSFITLWAADRNDPERYFTGYSYRAPRQDKLYSRMPAWMRGRNEKGLFLDGGVPVIRAIRTFRTMGIEARIAGHIPLDAHAARRIEIRLRFMPFLPNVQLVPAWPEPSGKAGRLEAIRRLFDTDIVVPAREWQTGAPRWVVYRARPYLPPGREKWTFIAYTSLLLLLPLGLSVWGASATYRRTVRPLKRLLVGIRLVEQGDLEYRLRDTGKSQIALAAQSFDKMAESLEQKIAELAEKKKVEEVSEMKSHFISMVSHDLKTPLASIKGAAENILEELAGPVSERQRAYLDMILRSSDNLQRMISDILDLSRIESGHLRLDIETLNAALEIEHVVRSVRPLLDARGIEALIAVTASGANVEADRTRFWQIVGNVMSNAIRYSPPGGRIEISVADAPARGGGRRMLAISIADRGPGITEDEDPRLFEPFYTRAAAGTGEHGVGLGLAIVKQLVELHGGSVSLRRGKEGGAVLTFTLPASDRA